MRILQDQTVGADFREQGARGPAEIKAARALSGVLKERGKKRHKFSAMKKFFFFLILLDFYHPGK